MEEGRDEICRRNDEAVETAMGETRDAASMKDARRMVRIMQTGA